MLDSLLGGALPIQPLTGYYRMQRLGLNFEIH